MLFSLFFWTNLSSLSFEHLRKVVRLKPIAPHQDLEHGEAVPFVLTTKGASSLETLNSSLLQSFVEMNSLIFCHKNLTLNDLQDSERVLVGQLRTLICNYTAENRGALIQEKFSMALRLDKEQRKQSGSDKCNPCTDYNWIFVIATGRSGSTSLINNLNAIPGVYIGGENRALRVLFNLPYFGGMSYLQINQHITNCSKGDKFIDKKLTKGGRLDAKSPDGNLFIRGNGKGAFKHMTISQKHLLCR